MYCCKLPDINYITKFISIFRGNYIIENIYKFNLEKTKYAYNLYLLFKNDIYLRNDHYREQKKCQRTDPCKGLSRNRKHSGSWTGLKFMPV